MQLWKDLRGKKKICLGEAGAQGIDLYFREFRESRAGGGVWDACRNRPMRQRNEKPAGGYRRLKCRKHVHRRFRGANLRLGGVCNTTQPQISHRSSVSLSRALARRRTHTHAWEGNLSLLRETSSCFSFTGTQGPIVASSQLSEVVRVPQRLAGLRHDQVSLGKGHSARFRLQPLKGHILFLSNPEPHGDV